MPTKNEIDIEQVREKATIVVDAAWEIASMVANKVQKISRWAIYNRPRLCHLAIYGKKRKTRKKNLRRIMREYSKGSADQ